MSAPNGERVSAVTGHSFESVVSFPWVSQIRGRDTDKSLITKTYLKALAGKHLTQVLGPSVSA